MGTIVQDAAEILFVTRGVSQVVSDFQRMEQAARRYERVAEQAYYAPPGAARDRVQQALQDTVRNASMQAAQRSALVATAAIGFLREEISAVREAIDAYAEYGRQVRTVQALSGGSVRQSEQFVNLAKVAGIGDGQSIREITRLAQDMTSGKGRAAMSALGVSNGQNELETFQRVIVALGKMQDGARKTGLEVALFGQRGVQSLQPLLQMSGDISEKTLALSANIDGAALSAITHFQQNVALLGQTFLTELVIPIAQMVLPALELIVNGVEGVLHAFHDFNEATHGFGTFALVVVGIGAGFLAAVTAVVSFGKALKALLAIEEVQAVVAATIDALQGNWVNIAAAVAIGGVAIGGAYAANSYLNGDKQSGGAGDTLNNAANTMQTSAQTFAGAVNGLARSLNNIAGNEISGNMTAADLQLIIQRNAQGIG